MFINREFRIIQHSILTATSLFSQVQDKCNSVMVTIVRWRLKNHLNDALYHGGDMALRRSIVEIKSYEEYVTSNLVGAYCDDISNNG